MASGDLDTIGELLDDAGLATVNATTSVTQQEKSEQEWTPLLIAARSSDVAAATLLCERGADPNEVAYTQKGLTALIVAITGGGKSSRPAHDDDAEKMVKLLIEKGADVDTIGTDGATAFHVACFLGLQKCAVALIEAGACLTIRDDDGQTARELAIQKGLPFAVALGEAVKRMPTFPPAPSEDSDL